MKSAFATALLILVMAAGADAQPLPYDHLHFGVPEPAVATEWYLKHLEAQPRREDDLPDRVRYGNAIVAFSNSPTPKPSLGSTIDHVGFSVKNVDAKMKELEAAGAKVVTPAHDMPGLYRMGVVVDPWGATLEIVQDPETPGLHHIHLRVPDPEATMKWYLEMMGGQRTRLKGKLDAIKYVNPNLWLLADKGDNVEPSQGHTIDHLGWHTPDVDVKIAELKAKGVKITSEPRETKGLRPGFIEDPVGVRIELLRRPNRQ